MALIGNGFQGWLKKQVEVRQKTLGQGFDTKKNFNNSLPNSNAAFLNSSPWIRLMSSVDLTTPTDQERKDSSVPAGVQTVLEILQSKPEFSDIANSLGGDKLAKKFILHNGVMSQGSGVDGMYAGNSNKGDNGTPNPDKYPFGGAYGFGGGAELESGRGYIPLPGIVSADFKFKNDGALSQASLEVKAYSQFQFQIIDILFQRPGYTVLMEFGHSIFLDNDGNTQYAGEGDYATTEPFSLIFKSKLQQYKLAAAIAKEKQKWCGNYEANFMRITKFNWKFNPDGTYDITINLIGTGDLINSLKANIAPDSELKLEAEESDNPSQETREEAAEEGLTIISEAIASKLNNELYTIFQSQQDSGTSWLVYLIPIYGQIKAAYDLAKATFFDDYGIQNAAVAPFPVPEYRYRAPDGNIESEDPAKLESGQQNENNRFFVGFKNSQDAEGKGIEIPGGILTVNRAAVTKTDTKYDPQTFITFGYLLALVTTNCNLVDGGGNPLTFFDFNFQDLAKDDNYMVTFPGMFSADPNICLIPPSGVSPDISKATSERQSGFLGKSKGTPNPGGTTDLGAVLANEKAAPFNTDKQTKGRLASVYLDINFITDTLKNNKDEKNMTISIVDFLNDILGAIDSCTGGVNDFRVMFNEDTHLINIRSQVPMDLEDEYKDPDLTTIQTYGLLPNQGSFVKNVNLKAELTDEFATMISVGAQNNGNTLGTNAGSFAYYNFGLKDRIIPVKKSSKKDEKSKEDYTDTVEPSKDPIGDIYTEKVHEVFGEVYDDLNATSDNISTLKNINSDYASMVLGEMGSGRKSPNGKPSAPPPQFLPFNLSLEMHGIAGIKIFQAFKQAGNMLPYNYDNSKIKLVIKSYSHKIDIDGWTTSIETISQPLYGKIESVSPAEYSGGSPGGTAGSTSNAYAGSQPLSSAGTYPEVPGGTLTSNFPLNKIYYDGPTNKTQIYIHHTAGATKSPAKTVAGWNKRSDHVATHYITNNLGDVEQLYADEAWANHLGIAGSTFRSYGVRYQNLNITSLGIEMQSYGWCKLVGGKYITAYKNSIPANTVGRPVDKNGNFTTYKGYKYYQKYNDQHIENVKQILLRWMNKYNIPFKYDYDTLFTLNTKALSGVPGIYTHNSVKLGKTDVWPQKELLDMLKSISS